MLGLGQDVLDGCVGGSFAGLMSSLAFDEFQQFCKHLYMVEMDKRCLEQMKNV